MIKIKILCIFIITIGIAGFILTYLLLPASSLCYAWCLGLASALIIIGLGYLLNLLLLSANKKNTILPASVTLRQQHLSIKVKAGYLVCKVMNVLLCTYILILHEMHVKTIILLPGITLLILQYLMDLILQLYYSLKNNEDIS